MAYTYEEVMTALRAADAAGDSAAASRLAEIASGMRKPVEQKVEPKEDASLGRVAVRGITKGITGLAGLPVDAVAGAMRGLGLPVSQKPFLGTESLRGMLGDVGVELENPNPQDYLSRVVHRGGEIAGSSIVPGAKVGSTLSASAGGALAGEVLGKEYEIAGMLAPTATNMALRKTLAATPAQIAERQARLAKAKEIGMDLTASQVTGGRSAAGFENIVGRLPAGDVVLAAKREAQQAAMANKAMTGTSSIEGGRAIKKGVENWLDKTKSVYEKLDAATAAKIPATATLVPTNTMNALDEVTSSVVGSKAFVSPKLEALKNDITAYVSSGNQVPFQELRKLRTRVGYMMNDMSLTKDVSQAELSKLYGSMTDDMRAIAKTAGAEKEFAKANQYWRARQSRVNEVLDDVIGKDRMPEDIFRVFMPKNPNEASRVRSVMKSLGEDERKVVAEAVANSLGRAGKGKQNELGDVFSSETFLSNWNNLSKQAKAQIFSNAKMRADLDAIAENAAMIRQGSGVMSNASGTAGSLSAIQTYQAPLKALALFQVAPVAEAGVALGSAYLGAKLMTNPKFVSWLAKSPSVRADQTGVHLARLSAMFNGADEETKEAVAAYIESVKQTNEEQ